jgi:hypothetical protein
MAIHAVITGDIVNSTLLPSKSNMDLHKKLRGIFAKHPFEFFRGDSFQAYMDDPGKALKMAMQCRVSAIALSNPASQFDVRLGIGIGAVDPPVEPLNIAKGEAFVLSGRALDEIAHTRVRMKIAAGDAMAGEALAVIAQYADDIFSTMSVKQAAVIHFLLDGRPQLWIAEKLNKSKSTVHQLVVAAKWEKLSWLLDRYENIINLLK